MTVKEASDKFHCSEVEIRKRIRDGMPVIAPTKEDRRIVLADSTTILPSKKEIQAFLLQILQYKNNESYIIARNLCPDADKLKIVAEYLYEKGFIGEYVFDADIRILFHRIQLTNNGLQFLMGASTYQKTANFTFTPITVNPTVKIGLINIR